MKKAFLGVLAFTLMSGVVFASDPGKRKTEKKAKIECTKSCPDSKDCHKSAKCPNKPGCICN
jgi:hypothetical protein